MNNHQIYVEQELKVMAYDIDAMGIVSNIVYVRWFEDLRMLLLDEHMPYNEIIALNISPILMKTEVQYKTPLTIQSSPKGRCTISNMGGTKWEMEFKIYSGDIIHCTGKQVGCFYDLQTKRPTIAPEKLRNAYVEAVK
ncbi:acyl-CoA thioesterase [Puteibacter caeruleilacunae]|nr:acyl-CoA thioesterase [Puteibacter caeruleilacunae]